MTDAALVTRKLSVLREHRSRIERRRPQSIEALKADVDLQDALAMSLLVAIQEAIDIALHVASDEKWGVAASSSESFELLARHGAISADLARELAAMVGLRNRLAHGYASVDLGRVWSELPRGMRALDAYEVEIARFLTQP
jgi:uncharacterized protein YutE (UPF0331/DUF86 family)